MTIINAFVGHSFTKDDEILNNTFLTYLDQIKAMDIGFTWESAKAAEPKELAEKVMSLIRNKNLFFGICTKKERVIASNELKRCWISRKMLGADEKKFQWKTSDWIIQEIGLAIGRDMNLILLIEEGTRPPGGLQGNIEYIEFNRQNPECSFGKILEMIRALMPKVSKIQTQAISSTSAESSSQEQEQKAVDMSWSEPTPEWTYQKYKSALRRSIFFEDSEAEKKINTAFLESQEGKSPQRHAAWQTFREYLLLVCGKGGTLVKIEALAKENPDVSEVQHYLGHAYDRYKEHAKSATAYSHAAEKTEVAADKHDFLRKAAIAYCRAGMKLKSEEIIAGMKQDLLESPDLEENLLLTLREIAEIDSETDAFYGLSERLLELKPDDTDVRFNLAYKYSQDDKGNLSLFQYLRIPEVNRESVAWNNLGAQYDIFEMPGLSVNCYRKSAEDGVTIAMSNLANKFTKVGFLSEAEEMCKKALQIENYHNNVNYSMTRIRDIPDEEANKEKQIVEQAARLSDFYRAYGRSLCKTNVNDHVGNWDGPKCGLHVTIQGLNFSAEGTYDINRGHGLAHYYSPLTFQEPAIEHERYTIKYIGRLLGYSIKAVMTEEKVSVEESGPTITGSLLGIGIPVKSKRNVLMVISDSLDEIRVYDQKEPEDNRFHVLKLLKKQ